MADYSSRFAVTPTMWEFMEDDSYVRLLAGSVGSGKSVCCSHELVRLAMGQQPGPDGVRRTRAAIIRNTWDQLKTTTWQTFTSWFPVGVWGMYKASEKTFYMDYALPDGTRLKAEFMFLPLDDPADVRKVLSLELTHAWINECREVRPEIIDGILMRLRRYPSQKDGGPTRSCAIMDTNMPDEDSWLFHKMEDPPENWGVFIQPPAILTFEEYFNAYNEEPNEFDGVEASDGTKYWVNPEADNLEHLDARYYPDIIPGKSVDFVNVYLRCRYGRSLSGVPVYEKTFDPEFHIAKEPFLPIRADNYPIIVGLDFGRTPACVLLQRNAFGQIVCLAELTSTNMGIEKFLSTKLMPLLSDPRFVGLPVVIAPDPAGWAKQQIGEVSPVDIIKQHGFTVAKPLTNDPARRIESVERVLLQHLDGKPAFVVNPECVQLIKGFRFGYRYKVNRQGVQENKPEKGELSHVHDSCQYGCLVIEGGQAYGGRTINHKREVVPAMAAGWT